MNWGWKIALVYGAFVVMVLATVVFAMRQEVFLVEKDYYKQELAYQGQIDKMNNAMKLESDILVRQEGNYVYIHLPKSMIGKVSDGEVHFFRPSDASLDKKFALEINDEGVHQTHTGGMTKGLWRLKISWEANGIPYYDEQALMLN